MKHNFEKGYTLAEMITVIAIIVIAAGIFANFGSSQKQLSLQRDVYSFAQNIRRVQQMASSISTVTNCDPSGQTQMVPRNGYGVFLEKGQGRYLLYANCDCARGADNKCLAPYDIPEGSDIYASGERVMNSPIKLSNQVEISKIVGKKNGAIVGDPDTGLAGVVILYQPPDPAVQIFAPDNTALDEAYIDIKLKDGQYRTVEINRAGLVNVMQIK